MKVVCNKTNQGITKDSQYAVIASFTSIDNEKRYMIENDYKRVETYPQSMFSAIIETKPDAKKGEDLSVFEMMHLDPVNIDWIKIKVRKESR